MINRLLTFVLILTFTSISIAANTHAQDKPIRALMITGGCCHDYTNQKRIISEGLAARANIIVDVVQQGGTTTNTKIPVYGNPDWYQGYDIIIHNECFAGVTDPEWTKKIIKPHHDGLPAVVLHCAMHSYRDKTDEWFKFVGVTSHRHGAHYPYEVVNLQPRNFIMQNMGARWKTPQGELYLISKEWPNTTPLAKAWSKDSKKLETCIWTNQYGKGRVFGTTIGHHNETMATPEYLDMLTRGVLWACKKEDNKYFKLPLIKQNLAKGKKATAQNSQDDSKQPHFAIDGNPGTRWCAHNGDAGYWWQLDLGKPTKYEEIAIQWEFDDGHYQYTLSGSNDGKTWETVADRSKFAPFNGIHIIKSNGKPYRHFKVHVNSVRNGQWVSIREFEVRSGKIKQSTLPTIEEDRKNKAQSFRPRVKVPDGFDYTIYAVPPDINYPTCVTASINGVVFVGVDENGSLDRDRGRGRIIRCEDTDNDGRADKFSTFALIDSPRGLIYDGKNLIVMHPPDLTVLRDNNNDGIADEQKTLIKGIGFDLDFRGADHTTNAASLGIDGWVYIAIGDYGFMQATGSDNKNLKLRGGGVVRVRPDGSEMELVAKGLRNIYDVSVDSKLNLFTRDNTNDGGGWNVRFSHIVPTANYGYPSLYKNFGDENMPPIKDHGGGSGTGAAYVQDKRYPTKYQSLVLTADWGRSMVYFHPVKPKGAWFEDAQENFVQIPRPTDADGDGLGNIYITSWMNGGFNFKAPEVGFVIQMRPTGMPRQPKFNMAGNDQSIVDLLKSGNHAIRMQAQQELIRRGNPTTPAILQLIKSSTETLETRIAAIYTYKQILGTDANKPLLALLNNKPIKPYLLKAVVDRLNQTAGVSPQIYLDALNDSDLQVKREAILGLVRLNAKQAAPAIFTYTTHTDPVISHIAIKALVSLQAYDLVNQKLASSDESAQLTALRIMREMHNDKVVDALIAKLNKTSPKVETELLTTLIRLYHLEGEWKKGWWGTRPDTSGPYYQREKWSASDQIETALVNYLKSAKPPVIEHALTQFKRHKVTLKSLPQNVQQIAMANNKNAQGKDDSKLVVVPKEIKDNAVGKLTPAETLKALGNKKGDIALGKKLFIQQGCAVCHTVSESETPKGPYLGQVGAKYSRAEILQSILEPNKVVSQGFETTSVTLNNGGAIVGFISKESGDEIEIRMITGQSQTLKKADIKKRTHLPISMMPPGLVANLKLNELRALLTYLENMK